MPTKVKLEGTLNFLATGNNYRSLQHFFRVSKPAISNFIPEVCDAIYDSLREFIKVSLFSFYLPDNKNVLRAMY